MENSENSELNQIICGETSFSNENTFVLALSQESYVSNNPAIQSTETIRSENIDNEFFRLLQSLKGELFYEILKSE